MVTLAGRPEWTTNLGETGTFVHELGHNLGLRHGGLDNNATDRNETYKPNQRSSMNYRFQIGGVSTDSDFVTNDVHTYSMGMLNTLDETQVNESIGICDDSELDLDGSTRITRTTRQENVNSWPDCEDCDDDKSDILVDYDEWGNIKLIFNIDDKD